MEQRKQAYKAIHKICLNNWHYIDKKTLELNDNINFFTGHSGSGKSTVIDALQIVLYANTDGRGFFNKAAADDSDRNLIEYLRGMINIGENNQATYKRNQNFSTTIVLELMQTVTQECECVGVVFDVDTATNDVSRLFFWHKGALFDGEYRIGNRAMTIQELRETLQSQYSKEDYFYTSNNERYRRNLYDIYLGGLDMEKFPRLFKRAIPFRMNIRLEDFVKEYICMEQDIHMEDMKESVVLYGRMCQKIEATRKEIEELSAIENQYQIYKEQVANEESIEYRLKQLELLKIENAIDEIRQKIVFDTEDVKLQKQGLEELFNKKEEYLKLYDEVHGKILGSGYGDLEHERARVVELMERLERSKLRKEYLQEQLQKWEDEELASNQVIWDIEKFKAGTISGEELERLKRSLSDIREEVEKMRQEASSELRSLKKELEILDAELTEIRLGKKAYPRELEEARRLIQRGLYDKHHKTIAVEIFSDTIELKDEKWRNAIEGFLGWNKLSLLVEPAYVQDAMEIYESLDKKKYHKIALVDTKKLMEKEYQGKEGSLAGNITATKDYVVNYVNYLLGNVIQCEDVTQLRQQKIGVTAECMLYQNFQLRRLNPLHYRRNAFIGEKSMKKRQKELQLQFDGLTVKTREWEEELLHIKALLELEYLTQSTQDYMDLLSDLSELAKQQEKKERIDRKLELLETETLEEWKQELEEIRNRQREIERQMDQQKLAIHDKESGIEQYRQSVMEYQALLLEKQKLYHKNERFEPELEEYLSQQKQRSYEKMMQTSQQKLEQLREQTQLEHNRLVECRSDYLKNHPAREFSASGTENTEYQKLLEELSCDRILEYEKLAKKQANIAVEHFREDFVYKIRSAIKEAFLRRDELNRIIKNLNFGKDRYQFKITRNKGMDGEYYDIFMDETLEIQPDSLSASISHQMNMFSMNHEDKYGSKMNELIGFFIPPENATAKEQEEARLNMEKYADYRTYLSFEMEQIVEGEERLVIGLSKMIKKNSGGEGQNPLYVALLASFAQAYKIHTPTKLQQRPTIRLVVLDEAFSKMDAEKVASCIALIRELGFQAIISATNDKIQNYLENVDKTFVYANPNKKNISIQEFERKEFGELKDVEE